jgi:hypothetical protein
LSGGRKKGSKRERPIKSRNRAKEKKIKKLKNEPKIRLSSLLAGRLIEGKVARVVYGMGDKHESVYGHPSLQEAGIAVATFPNDLTQELLDLNKEWTDSLRVKPIPPPPNDTNGISGASYRKPGTPIEETLHLHVRPPKHDGGYYTIEDNNNNVLDYARTFDEIAAKWHAIDTQKRIMEKMQRVGGYNSDQRLGFH